MTIRLLRPMLAALFAALLATAPASAAAKKAAAKKAAKKPNAAAGAASAILEGCAATKPKGVRPAWPVPCTTLSSWVTGGMKGRSGSASSTQN